MAYSFTYDIEKVIPEHIRVEKPELVEFLDAYYHWLNEEGNPGYILNKLPDYRDIDLVAEEFIEYLQREIAVSIPENVRANKVKLYKNLVDFYLSRGSIPSYETLFKLVFDDTVELYFPRVDILKPSDGKWDDSNGVWLNDDGKLSSTKYLQDSRFYQAFSYVIKTGQTIDNWRDAVKKLLHPAGFAFFGQVVIFTEAVDDFSPQKTSAKMPLIQPGRAASDQFPFAVVSGSVRVPVDVGFLTLIIKLPIRAINAVGPTLFHLEQYKFLSPDPVDQYKQYSVADVLTGQKINTSISSDITITTAGP